MRAATKKNHKKGKWKSRNFQTRRNKKKGEKGGSGLTEQEAEQKSSTGINFRASGMERVIRRERIGEEKGVGRPYRRAGFFVSEGGRKNVGMRLSNRKEGKNVVSAGNGIAPMLD